MIISFYNCVSDSNDKHINNSQATRDRVLNELFKFMKSTRFLTNLIKFRPNFIDIAISFVKLFNDIAISFEMSRGFYNCCPNHMHMSYISADFQSIIDLS